MPVIEDTITVGVPAIRSAFRRLATDVYTPSNTPERSKALLKDMLKDVLNAEDVGDAELNMSRASAMQHIADQMHTEANAILEEAERMTKMAQSLASTALRSKLEARIDATASKLK